MLNQCFPIICLECHQFPQIQLNNSSELTINCSCGNDKTKLINNYLEELRNENERNNKINYKCWFHENNLCDYYCIECEINLCKICKDIHTNHHKIIDLTIPINTTIIQNELQTNLENITISMLTSKNEEIKYYIDKINEIEYQYQQKIQQINYHSLLIKSIIYTYTHYKYNYNCIKNVLTNCYFDKSIINPFDRSNQTFENYCNSISLIYRSNPFKREISNILISINKNKIHNGEISLFNTNSNDNKCIYYGEIVEGERNGFGIRYYSNHNIYKSHNKNDKLEGYGVFHFFNGYKYQGQYKDDKNNGYGICIYSDGVKYEGEWKNGRREGYGIFYFLDIEKYEGEWKDDKRNGYGIYHYSDGGNYEGEWKDDKRNGYGVYNYFEGVKYEGEWKDDKIEGYGIFYYIEGNKYEGQIKDGCYNGYGTFYSSDGEIIEGEWKDNQFLFS